MSRITDRFGICREYTYPSQDYEVMQINGKKRFIAAQFLQEGFEHYGFKSKQMKYSDFQYNVVVWINDNDDYKKFKTAYQFLKKEYRKNKNNKEKMSHFSEIDSLSKKEFNDIVAQAKSKGITNLDKLGNFTENLPDEISERFTSTDLSTLMERLKIKRF